MKKTSVMMFLVCAMLSLNACGTDHTSKITVQANKPAGIAEVENKESKTMEPKETPSPGKYSVFTNYSQDEVEEFAKEVKEEILKKNWKALSKKLSYPLMFDAGEKDQIAIENNKFYKKIDLGVYLSDAFIEAIKRESCTDMFANSEGCMLGDGQIWIAERLDEESNTFELKVIAINN